MEKVFITMELEAEEIQKEKLDDLISSSLANEGYNVVNIGAYKNDKGEEITSDFYVNDGIFEKVCRDEMKNLNYEDTVIESFVKNDIGSFMGEWMMSNTGIGSKEEFVNSLAFYVGRNYAVQICLANYIDVWYSFYI